MRSFSRIDDVLDRVPSRVVTTLRAVDFGRGSEALYRDQLPGLLEALALRARVAIPYGIFERRAASARGTGTKQDRVREYVLRHASRVFRISDVRSAVPGCSDQTIRIVLDKSRVEGLVAAEGTGRSATWRRLPY